MEKEFILNSNMLPPLQYEYPFTSEISSWQSLYSSNPSDDCFLSPPPPATDHFDSALSSIVSSPASSGPTNPNDNSMIRELIGKLGNICNSGDAPHSLSPYIGDNGGGGGSGSGSNSCYSTPLSSPHKMRKPIFDRLMKENSPNLSNAIQFCSILPALPGDPGFAERAARFCSFGSKSFNGRTSQIGENNRNDAFDYGSNENVCLNGQLQRVLSSPSMKVGGSQVENTVNNRGKTGDLILDQGLLSNCMGNSTFSTQNPASEIGLNRKRKAISKGKAKENQMALPTNSKEEKNGEETIAKRSKSEESSGTENVKTEENRGDECKKQSSSNQRPPEPPKDYIHVRARRGQATDSHSLAERVRREKISERMKLLQDLVPGCNKVTGKALMLDEIINYVQSLQRQVEFLSMKLASVNPRPESNMGSHFSKEVIQPNCSLRHPMYSLDSLAPHLYGQPHQNSLTNGGSILGPSSMDPLNQNNSYLQLPYVNSFSYGVPPQQTSPCEGDLQSIVQMGYMRKEDKIQSQPASHETNRAQLNESRILTTNHQDKI